MKLRLVLFLILLSALYSCDSGSKSGKSFTAAAQITSNEPEQLSNIKIEIPDERKIIKHGELRFESSNLSETELLINRSVSELGGYISKDNIYEGNDRITHRMELRVPADKFDLLLAKITDSAKKLDSKNISAQDVTEEYVDIEARIKTKKALENRYKELLSKAETVEEILSIEKEIGALRSDIESIEGRLKYLNDRVGLSALNIEFYHLTSSQFGFLSKLSRGFVSGWNWFLSFIIGLIHFWPFILIGCVIAYLFISINKKRKKAGSKS